VKLVEELSGTGDVAVGDRHFPGVEYRINRFQAFTPSGLPVPGLHRVEGSLGLGEIPGEPIRVGTDLTLELGDGRTLRLTLADEHGAVLQEGHGPSRCMCC
jgi:hypothetical protein